jgi:MYXO-CTERM domain-containing protein
MQGPSSCQLEIVGCDVNADCASGFTCEDNRDGSCTMGSDGETVCETPDPAKVCMPPYTDLTGDIGAYPSRGADEASGGPISDGESGEDGAEEPAAPADADDAGANSNASGGGCALVASGSSPSSPWWALGALVGAVLLRRRGLGR